MRGLRHRRSRGQQRRQRRHGGRREQRRPTSPSPWTGATFAAPITANDLQYFEGTNESGDVSRTLKGGGNTWATRTVTFSLSIETARSRTSTTGGAESSVVQAAVAAGDPGGSERDCGGQRVLTQVRGATIRSSIQAHHAPVANPFPARHIRRVRRYQDPVKQPSGLSRLSPKTGGSDDSIAVRLYPALAETSLGPAGSTANNSGHGGRRQP